MTDRELLELAVKAAGLEGEWVEDSFLDDYYKLPTTGYLTVSEGRNHIWNPLTSSGDALRLAVKLGMEFSIESDIGAVVATARWRDGEILPDACGTAAFEDSDPYAATRRAIVRAAAEIGRNMK